MCGVTFSLNINSVNFFRSSLCTFNNQMNLNGFIEKKVLGHGTYGQVYKAIRESDGKAYAVKVVNLSKLSRREIEDAVNEIRIMASFTSPFIIGFYEAFCDQKRICIVTEYAQLGDLSNLLERRKRRNKPLTEVAIWRFLLQLLEGLNVLHSCGVVHRDLKSANILLSAPDLIKIGDLGISTVLHSRQLAKTQIGTPLYLAPEVWKNKPYDQKCDMWSLGVLLYEMMTFGFPFNGRTTDDLARRICLGTYVQPRGYSADLLSIIRRLLQVNPQERPTVSDLLSLQCVKEHMDLLNPFIVPQLRLGAHSQQLLSTIKVPMTGIRNVNLPDPSYGKRVNIVKPLGQRLHMKQGPGVYSRDISEVSTPELKLITDQDLWSPNKLDAPMQQGPLSYRPPLKPLAPAKPVLPQEAQDASVVEMKMARKRDPTRKITFILGKRKLDAIIDNNIQFKPICQMKPQENVPDNRPYFDPRWRQIPVAQPPQPKLQPPMPEPDRYAFFGAVLPEQRKHAPVAINPRFRRAMGIH